MQHQLQAVAQTLVNEVKRQDCAPLMQQALPSGSTQEPASGRHNQHRAEQVQQEEAAQVDIQHAAVTGSAVHVTDSGHTSSENALGTSATEASAARTSQTAHEVCTANPNHCCHHQ